jgi:hypothetical protein
VILLAILSVLLCVPFGPQATVTTPPAATAPPATNPPAAPAEKLQPVVANLVPSFVMTAAGDEAVSGLSKNVATFLQIESRHKAAGKHFDWSFGGLLGYMPSTVMTTTEKSTAGTAGTAQEPKPDQSGTLNALFQPRLNLRHGKSSEIAFGAGVGVSELVDPTPVKAAGQDAVVLAPAGNAGLATYKQLDLSWNLFNYDLEDGDHEEIRNPVFTVGLTIRQDDRLLARGPLSDYFHPELRTIVHAAFRDLPVFGLKRDTDEHVKPLTFSMGLEYEAPLPGAGDRKTVPPGLRVIMTGELNVWKLLTGSGSQD